MKGKKALQKWEKGLKRGLDITCCQKVGNTEIADFGVCAKKQIMPQNRA